MIFRHLLLAALASLLAGDAIAAAPVAPFQRGLAPRPFAPTRFSVTVTGSGPDVILIPGLTASSNVWKGSVAALPGYRYHLVQVCGFAGTPPRGNARGAVVAPLAEEISAYIASRGLSRPALVGHSMGGTVAMMVAARHPLRVGKVMVVDMLPEPAGLLGSTAAGVRGIGDLIRGLGGSAGGRRLVESMIGLFGADETAGSRSDPDVVARATDELARTDLTPELPRIAAPLTVVYAVLDDTRRLSADRAYASAYAPKRGTKLIRIDNSGHMIMYDQPAKFRAALGAFLRQ